MTERETSTGHPLQARLREVVAATRVGERLPSERELSMRHGVARMTIRHAMDALVDEGLVERRHGSGTYVLPQPLVRLLGLTSFTQDMRERGLEPSSQLLDFQVIGAGGGLAAQLRIASGERVINFTRLRLGGDEAMAVETVWIPAAIVPGLGPADLDGSLYELLARRYGIVPGSASVTIEPVLTDPTTRLRLGVAVDQPCLRIRMVDADTRRHVIMIADCVYRGDKYQLSADISGAAFSSVQARRAG